MGACYSKSAIGSPKDKGQKPKRRSFRKSKTPEEEVSPQNEKLLTNGQAISQTQYVEVAMEDDHVTGGQHEESRSSTPVLECDDKLLQQLGISVETGVAPSDSGIESLGTAPEEGQQEVVIRRHSQNPPDDLARRLERLSRGSCHKCGNFMLDDNVLTALLSDTYCLCGPRQAGKPTVNPDCRTHGLRKDRKTVSNSGLQSQNTTGNSVEKRVVQKELRFMTDNENSSPVSNGEENVPTPELVREDSRARISVRSADSLNLAMSILSSVDGVNLICGGEVDNGNAGPAPLAQCDSIDNILNGSAKSLDRQKRLSTGSRKSLLSEILDITNSICKCDFYSNEFHCSLDHHAPSSSNVHQNYSSCAQNDETGLPSSGVENGSFSMCSNDDTTEFVSEIKMGPLSSAPKNVSFAKDSETPDNKVVNKSISPWKSLSRSNRNSLTYQDSSISETSSGVFTRSCGSEPRLTNGYKASPKRPSSIGSRGMLISDSESEVFEGTEDDLGSVDLDSLSRVTSLSYSSIRQLVESTEDLCGPLDNTARRMTIEGVDCVVIPTVAYRQMQGELSSLRQQLLALASLMQEEHENIETSGLGDDCVKQLDLSQ